MMGAPKVQSTSLQRDRVLLDAPAMQLCLFNTAAPPNEVLYFAILVPNFGFYESINEHFRYYGNLVAKAL